MQLSSLRAAVAVLLVSVALWPSASQAKSTIDVVFELLRQASRIAEKAGPLFPTIWMKQTSDQLDDIINRSAQITEELKQVNITIKKELAEAFSNFMEHTLKADINQYEVNLSELRDYQKQDDSSHRRIDLLTHNLERDILTSLDYGPATYQTSYAAVIAVRMVYRYVGVPRDHQHTFFSKISGYYGDWADQTKEGSPAALVHSEEVQIDAIRKEVSDKISESKGCYEVIGDLSDKNDYRARRLSYKPTCLMGDPTGPLNDRKHEYKKHVEIFDRLTTVVSQLRTLHKALLKDQVGF
jgi:hypothetical protein